MTNRPFGVHYVGVDRPADLRVAVSYAPRDGRLQAATDALDRVFTQLERFGSAGGFAGNMCPPARSNVRRLGVSAHDESFREWSFEIADVSPGLLFFIGNILHRHSLEEAAVSQVAIASSLWRAQTPVEAPPPKYFKPLPFAFEDCLESRRAVVTVRFVDKVPDSVRAVFEDVWRAWVQLAWAGAFSDESFDIGRSTLQVTEEPLSLPDEIMFVHDRALIARTGFDCLVNTFHALHTRLALLEEVVIS
jgi:hypothetical protein